MAVVAAFEFDDFIAAGGASRQANGAHGRFGAGADQTHFFNGRHAGNNGFGQA